MSILELGRAEIRARETPSLLQTTVGAPDTKQPHMFAAIFLAWGLALWWFHPRMWSLTDLAEGPFALASIAYFVVFAELAWLYGLYNIGVVAFALLERARADRAPVRATALTDTPAVAVLYTTCNDFLERSALSCVTLSYPNFHIYILDDSTEASIQRRIDDFADRYLDRVTVVRRADRRGFKAGNLNNALANVVREPFFAVVDADEILPSDFLGGLMSRMMAAPKCGFVQANHRSDPVSESQLAKDLGPGIDVHWKWYQPLRNRYGFVMFLGHGALLRRSCWEEVGGFPEIVSEDLGYAIALRERGYYGVFAEEVVCFEEFPESVRAFRLRHVKWTRGTCEFLHKWTARLLRAKRITTAEKLDILFPTLNLPLTFFYFLFMINAALALPLVLGAPQNVTVVLLGQEYVFGALGFRPGVERVFGVDFFLITLMTILAPILCFILEWAREPRKLLRFLTHSTALYAALSPLSFIAVVGYALTRRATFLVTGAASSLNARVRGQGAGLLSRLRGGLAQTHPDSPGVQAFEFAAGAGFFVAALATVQISFIGVALGFMLLPLLHRLGWANEAVRPFVWLPAALIAVGISIGASGVAGLQPVFFGFGFHF